MCCEKLYKSKVDLTVLPQPTAYLDSISAITCTKATLYNATCCRPRLCLTLRYRGVKPERERESDENNTALNADLTISICALMALLIHYPLHFLWLMTHCECHQFSSSLLLTETHTPRLMERRAV